MAIRVNDPLNKSLKICSGIKYFYFFILYIFPKIPKIALRKSSGHFGEINQAYSEKSLENAEYPRLVGERFI